MQVEGKGGASIDAVYRDGVAGSGASTVNLPHNLLWGLLDANRLISPHEMDARVFVLSADQRRPIAGSLMGLSVSQFANRLSIASS